MTKLTDSNKCSFSDRFDLLERGYQEVRGEGDGGGSVLNGMTDLDWFILSKQVEGFRGY